MGLYKYKARNGGGAAQVVTIEGDSPDDALGRLRSRGFVPVKFLGEAGQVGGALPFGRRRDSFDVYGFTNRLTPLLEAQITLERALAIMAEPTGGEDRNHAVIVSLRKGLHEGKKFSELIRSHGGRFPRIYANLVETGEETGCLTEVMTELQRFLNESREQRDFLITSSIYPLTILTITLGVMVLMFAVFIPRFSKIFLDMGKELPLPTEIMLTISTVFNTLWPLWLLLLCGVVWLIIRIRRGGRVREWWDGIALRLPVLGGIFQNVEISRFIRTLSILVGSQVHLLDSVRIATRVLGNSRLNRSFTGVPADLKEGKRISAALKKSVYMPGEAIQMLKVGEESGNIDYMLARIADGMERETKVKIKRLLAMFEPAVIVFLAIIVLLVVISIFLAVMEMNNI